MTESIPSERLEDVIRERDALVHSLNDMELRFQKAERELPAIKIEKHALTGKGGVFQAKQRGPQEYRHSLKDLIEDLAVSSAKKKRKGLLDCFFTLDVKYVAIDSTTLESMPEMGALELRELYTFQGPPKRRWNRRGRLFIDTGGSAVRRSLYCSASGTVPHFL